MFRAGAARQVKLQTGMTAPIRERDRLPSAATVAAVDSEQPASTARDSAANANSSNVLTPARRLARRLLEPRPGTARRLPLGPARGITFEAHPHLSLDYWLGLYESELTSWLRRFCRIGTRCVDVGALNAYHALTFAKLTREQVLSYEPDSQAVERSRRNLALNPTLARLIEVRAVAIGARPGPGVVTLDAELLPLTRRAQQAAWMLKIDVDGPELDVLTGAADFLALIRPHVIVETHAPGLEEACGACAARSRLFA